MRTIKGGGEVSGCRLTGAENREKWENILSLLLSQAVVFSRQVVVEAAANFHISRGWWLWAACAAAGFLPGGWRWGGARRDGKAVRKAKFSFCCISLGQSEIFLTLIFFSVARSLCGRSRLITAEFTEVSLEVFRRIGCTCWGPRGHLETDSSAIDAQNLEVETKSLVPPKSLLFWRLFFELLIL